MARIAGEQGKYWEMHYLLFEKQGEWSNASDPSDLFVEYASSLEMDTSEIKTKLSAKVYQKEIEQDLADARLLGVDSTPTFFVGDTIIRTANANLIKETIDTKLAE
jgi:protein-disulfide isomerase